MKKMMYAMSCCAVLIFALDSRAFATTNISVMNNWLVYADKTNPTTAQSVHLEFVANGKGGTPEPYLELQNIPGCTFSKQTLESVSLYDGTFDPTDITCTTSGTKQIKLIMGDHVLGPPPEIVVYHFANLTFTQAPTPTPKPASTPKATPTPAPQAPTVPKLELLKTSSGAEYLPDVIKEQNYELKNGITFSGVTIPNGIVHLYFHSDPFEDTTTADSGGNWTYTLNQDIGSGDHSLQLAVTDPATNITSEKSSAYNFTIAESAVSNSTTEPEATSNTNTYIMIAVGALLILAAAMVLYLFVLRKRFGKKMIGHDPIHVTPDTVIPKENTHQAHVVDK